jgi:hypothetical protein
MVKSDFDHVDIAEAVENEKLGYMTPYLSVYLIVGILTSTDSVTEALLSFFPLVDDLQKCVIKLRSKNTGAQKNPQF